METAAPVRIGKFEFTVTTSQASDEETESRRAEVLTAWLLNEWDKKQTKRNAPPPFSAN